MEWGTVFGTIIGSILGFVMSVLPEVFAMVSQWLAHKRDLATNQQKIDAAKVDSANGAKKLGGEDGIKLEETTEVTSIPTPATVAFDEDTPHVGWALAILNLLRASVRPVVTYAFFAMFAFVKIYSMYHAYFVDHTMAEKLLPILWDEGTQSLFAAVLAFWFGSRAISKLTGNGNGAQATK